MPEVNRGLVFDSLSSQSRRAHLSQSIEETAVVLSRLPGDIIGSRTRRTFETLCDLDR